MEAIIRINNSTSGFFVLGLPPVGGTLRSKPCVIFLNAGMIHRVGPHRLYVELSRRLNELGFPTARFDFSGIGDCPGTAQGDSFSILAQRELSAVQDLLAKRGFNEFVLVGLCSGGDVAIQNALLDQRVVGIVSMNAYNLDRNLVVRFESDIRSKTSLRLKRKKLVSKSAITRILKLPPKIILQKSFAFLSKVTNRSQPTDGMADVLTSVDAQWNQLRNRNVSVLLIFSEGSDSKDAFDMFTKNSSHFERMGNRLSMEMIDDTDHTFTPAWSREILSKKIVAWINSLWQEIESKSKTA